MEISMEGAPFFFAWNLFSLVLLSFLGREVLFFHPFSASKKLLYPRLFSSYSGSLSSFYVCLISFVYFFLCFFLYVYVHVFLFLMCECASEWEAWAAKRGPAAFLCMFWKEMLYISWKNYWFFQELLLSCAHALHCFLIFREMWF